MAHIKLRDMDTICVRNTKQDAMDANMKSGVETPLLRIGSRVSKTCRCPLKMAQDFFYADGAGNSG
jgi:hypothetical protein